MREFFADFIGCDDYLEAKTDTKNMISAVEAHCNSLGYDIEQKSKKLQATKEFCIDSINLDDEGRIQLESLAKSIFPDSHVDFIALSQSDEYNLGDVVSPHKATLNLGTKFSGRNTSMSLTFMKSAFKEDIEFEYSTGYLKIKKLPDALLKELREEFKDSERKVGK